FPAHHDRSRQHQQRAGARVRGDRRGLRRVRLAVDHGASQPHDALDGSAHAHAGVGAMRVAIMWSVLAIANGTYLAMLVTLWRARSSAGVRRARWKVAGDMAWAIVPLLITALSAAPAVNHVFAAGVPAAGQRADTELLAPAAIVPDPISRPGSPRSGME